MSAEGKAALNEAWENVMVVLEEGKSLRHGEQLLGLEEFLGKLRAWQWRTPPEDVLLVFNADQIHLEEWLTALIVSSDEPRDTGEDSLMPSGGFSEVPGAGKALVLSPNDMRVADILAPEMEGNLLGESAGTLPHPEQLMPSVFDISQISFHDVLAS